MLCITKYHTSSPSSSCRCFTIHRKEVYDIGIGARLRSVFIIFVDNTRVCPVLKHHFNTQLIISNVVDSHVSQRYNILPVRTAHHQTQNRPPCVSFCVECNAHGRKHSRHGIHHGVPQVLKLLGHRRFPKLFLCPNTINCFMGVFAHSTQHVLAIVMQMACN